MTARLRTLVDRSRRLPLLARGVVAGAAVVLMAAPLACSSTGDLSDTAAPVTLIVGNLEKISDPFGDVLSNSGSIPDDSITIDFTARLKNSSDQTQPALQDVVIERYEVTFSRTDGGTALPAGFQRDMTERVRITPHGTQTEFITTVSLSIFPATLKAQPPISHLISPGFEPGTGFVSIQLQATIRFFGHTVSGKPVTTTAQVGMEMANWADNS